MWWNGGGRRVGRGGERRLALRIDASFSRSRPQKTAGIKNDRRNVRDIKRMQVYGTG
jgi:hypothetical protein